MKKIFVFKSSVLYVIVFVTSLVLNWLAQLFYYFLSVSHNPNAFLGQRTLLQYTTGVIGDGVIAPTINVLVWYFFLVLRFNPQKGLIFKAFVLSMLTDFLTHFFQGFFKLTNWSMPKPFQWDLAGYWHMISLPIQMTYLYLFFYAVLANREKIKGEGKLKTPVVAVFSLMILFLVLFLKDNQWM